MPLITSTHVPLVGTGSHDHAQLHRRLGMYPLYPGSENTGMEKELAVTATDDQLILKNIHKDGIQFQWLL